MKELFEISLKVTVLWPGGSRRPHTLKVSQQVVECIPHWIGPLRVMVRTCDLRMLDGGDALPEIFSEQENLDPCQ